LIFADILATRLALMPGAAELLDSLERAGIPKGIATSSGRRFVTDVLSRFDLEPRFRFVLTAEDVVEGKPHPEIYFKAAALFSVEPPSMLVLEDSQNGCRAAAASGAIAVAVPGGHSRRHDFSGATLVADSLADPRLYALLGTERN
jgi:HAD superfamily hydrolase (TIGR01509 family)